MPIKRSYDSTPSGAVLVALVVSLVVAAFVVVLLAYFSTLTKPGERVITGESNDKKSTTNFWQAAEVSPSGRFPSATASPPIPPGAVSKDGLPNGSGSQ